MYGVRERGWYGRDRSDDSVLAGSTDDTATRITATTAGGNIGTWYQERVQSDNKVHETGDNCCDKKATVESGESDEQTIAERNYDVSGSRSSCVATRPAVGDECVEGLPCGLFLDYGLARAIRTAVLNSPDCNRKRRQ